MYYPCITFTYTIFVTLFQLLSSIRDIFKEWMLCFVFCSDQQLWWWLVQHQDGAGRSKSVWLHSDLELEQVSFSQHQLRPHRQLCIWSKSTNCLHIEKLFIWRLSYPRAILFFFIAQTNRTLPILRNLIFFLSIFF